MNPTVVLIFVAVWVGVMVIWWVTTSVSRNADADKIKSRLMGVSNRSKSKKNQNAPALLAEEDRVTGKIVRRILEKYNLNERLQRLLEQSGLKWRVTRLAHASLALFLVGFVAAWYLLPGVYRQAATVIGLIAGFIPILYVLRRRKHRLRKFEELFPDSLEFVARSMRAGHAFSVSLEMIHREFQEPLSGEFRRTFEEHNLGLPLDLALQKLSQRVPSLDVHFFVSAVLLQKRTGGNLAEILDKLAYVIRERFKLRGKIRAISAHGRMTGTALTAIPCGVAGLMFVVNPDYVGFFFNDSIGQIMMGAAILLQLLGYAVMMKIVQIEV